MSSSWDLIDGQCLHTFVAGGRYIRVAASQRSFADVCEAIEDSMHNTSSTLVYLNTLHLNDEDFEFVCNTLNPEIII